MDGINIDELTIEQYLMLTQDNQAPNMINTKELENMTIAEYVEYEELMKRENNRNSRSYFPADYGNFTSSHNKSKEFPHCSHINLPPLLPCFKPIQLNNESDYDSDDMELDEEDGYITDEELVMSEQETSDPAGTPNTQSFKEELTLEYDLNEWLKAVMEKHITVYKSKQIDALETDKIVEESSMTINDTIEEDDSFTSTLPCQLPLKELSPRSFLFPCTIGSLNLYAMADLGACVNMMPNSIFKQLELDNLQETTMLVEIVFSDDGGGKDNGCGLPATLTQASTVIMKMFLEKINRECSGNGCASVIMRDGYVLDDVWEKCEKYHGRALDSWHDKEFEEDELWQSGDEKTDYETPFVNVKTYEIKKYSFRGGRNCICITKKEDDALPLGRVNGARFKAMIRIELGKIEDAHDET
ncbi:hypothetical protein Tco_1356593 [Tanacetum coccineum]